MTPQEIMAKAIADPWASWEALTETERAEWCEDATLVITALESAGYRIVPVDDLERLEALAREASANGPGE